MASEPHPPLLEPVDEGPRDLQLAALRADAVAPAPLVEPLAATPDVETRAEQASASVPEPRIEPTAAGGRPPHPSWMGLTLCAVIAAASAYVASAAHAGGISVGTLTLALVFGVLVGNTFSARVDGYADGVNLAKKQLLRIGIVLYGFRMTLANFESAGIAVFTIDALMVSSTFLMSMWLGVRVLKLDVQTSALVGAGSAICGASAVLATAPVVRARSEQISVAVSTVAVFGTAALLLYPLLYRANLQWGWVPGADTGFGTFIGSTVHDVGQVIAISNAVAASASDSAMIAKMGRVAMLLPFLLCISAWQQRDPSVRASGAKWYASMPLYPLLFALAVVANSLLPLHDASAVIVKIDEFVLAMAMVALGLSTRTSSLKEAGPMPLVLAGFLFVWLLVAGALVNIAVPMLVPAK